MSYSLAVRGNNIAKGSVMLILANLNATTIHSLLSSRSNGSLLRTKNVPTIGIIVSTQSQPVRQIDRAYFRDGTKLYVCQSDTLMQM